MTGYQKLRRKYELGKQLYYIAYGTLWEIANLKGPDVVHAPRKALEALTSMNKTQDETK